MITKLTICVLIEVLSVVLGVRHPEYCCFACCCKVHTMCIFPVPGPGPQCDKDTDNTLTVSQRHDLLDAHNKLRQQVANGRVNNQPNGSNIMEMIWDDEVEAIAKRWNDQCTFSHDKCRDTARFKCGQNMGMSRRKHTTRLDELIQDWFDEYKNLMPDGSTNGTVGHYTQLVWSQSYRLGCGATTQKYGSQIITMLTCNYGPAGNIQGNPTYKKGAACSDCPSGTSCSKTYPGLCALDCSNLYSSLCSDAVWNHKIGHISIFILLGFHFFLSTFNILMC